MLVTGLNWTEPPSELVSAPLATAVQTTVIPAPASTVVPAKGAANQRALPQTGLKVKKTLALRKALESNNPNVDQKTVLRNYILLNAGSC